MVAYRAERYVVYHTCYYAAADCTCNCVDPAAGYDSSAADNGSSAAGYNACSRAAAGRTPAMVYSPSASQEWDAVEDQ